MLVFEVLLPKFLHLSLIIVFKPLSKEATKSSSCTFFIQDLTLAKLIFFSSTPKAILFFKESSSKYGDCETKLGFEKLLIISPLKVLEDLKLNLSK